VLTDISPRRVGAPIQREALQQALRADRSAGSWARQTNTAAPQCVTGTTVGAGMVVSSGRARARPPPAPDRSHAGKACVGAGEATMKHTRREKGGGLAVAMFRVVRVVVKKMDNPAVPEREIREPLPSYRPRGPAGPCPVRLPRSTAAPSPAAARRLPGPQYHGNRGRHRRAPLVGPAARPRATTRPTSSHGSWSGFWRALARAPADREPGLVLTPTRRQRVRRQIKRAGLRGVRVRCTRLDEIAPCHPQVGILLQPESAAKALPRCRAQHPGSPRGLCSSSDKSPFVSGADLARPDHRRRTEPFPLRPGLAGRRAAHWRRDRPPTISGFPRWCWGAIPTSFCAS